MLKELENTTPLFEELERFRDKPENQHDSLVFLSVRYFLRKYNWILSGLGCQTQMPVFDDLRYGIRYDAQLGPKSDKNKYALELYNNVPGTASLASKVSERVVEGNAGRGIIVIAKTYDNQFLQACRENRLFVYQVTIRGGKRTLEPVIGIGAKLKKHYT